MHDTYLFISKQLEACLDRNTQSMNDDDDISNRLPNVLLMTCFKLITNQNEHVFLGDLNDNNSNNNHTSRSHGATWHSTLSLLFDVNCVRFKKSIINRSNAVSSIFSYRCFGVGHVIGMSLLFLAFRLSDTVYQKSHGKLKRDAYIFIFKTNRFRKLAFSWWSARRRKTEYYKHIYFIQVHNIEERRRDVLLAKVKISYFRRIFPHYWWTFSHFRRSFSHF